MKRSSGTSEDRAGGKWVKGPGMELIDALIPMCKNRLIIAEDLGDITPEVEKLVSNSGFPEMRVLRFGFLDESPSTHIPHNYVENHGYPRQQNSAGLCVDA